MGAPVQVTQHAPGENFHFYPHFLPDGEHFLYTIDEPPGVYVGSVAGDPGPLERKVVMPGFASVAYVPDLRSEGGHLLFARDGSLYAQPFDIDSFDVRGEPVSIATEIGNTTAQEPSQFSVSRTGILTTVAATLSAVSIVSRGGGVLGMTGERGPYGTMRPSPDGDRVLLLRAEPGGQTFELWLMDLERGTPTRLTNHQANAPFQAWSPDGSAVAYSSNHGGRLDVFNVYTQRLDGGEAVAIPPSNNRFQSVSDWTPAGIIYGERQSAAVQHVWLWPAKGGEPLPLVSSPYLNYGATLSPDQRWLAYVSNESGADEVYVQSFPAARGKTRISTSGGSSPTWGASGRELFYNTAGRGLMVVPILPADDQFAYGRPQLLFDLRTISGFRGAALWWPARDERFLVLRPATENASIHLTFNWPTLLD